MNTRIFIFLLMSVFAFSCSTTSKQPEKPSYGVDAVYDGLQIGMPKSDVIKALGKSYTYDMNNVYVSAENYVETLIWNSSDANVVYVLSFTNEKLSRKTREQVVKDSSGGNIQLNR